MEKFLSRKFLFTLLLLALGFCVDFFTSRGLSANLKELIVYLGGIYVVGNSASAVTGAIMSRREVKASDVDPEAFQRVLGQLDQSLNTIHSSQEAIINNVSLGNKALGELVRKSNSPLK